MITRIVLAVLTASALLLGGCTVPGAGGIGSSAGPAPLAPGIPGPEVPAPDRPTQGGVPAVAPEAPPGVDAAGREVARTASVTVVVPDVLAAADRIRASATGLDGWVAWESIALGSVEDGLPIRPSGSTVTLSVPAHRLDEAVALMAGLGTVRHRASTADDVTVVVTDLDARVRSLEASIARIEGLMGRAGTITEIAQVERELSTRQAELESLRARQQHVRTAVERATLSVTLLTQAQSETTDPVVAGLSRGWQAFLTSIALLLTVVGAVAPFALVLGFLAGVLLWWRRHRRLRAVAGASDLGRMDVPASNVDGAGDQNQGEHDANDIP